MDLKLNADGDLDLSTGDLQLVSGVDETVQRLKIKLQFFLGEWFLDKRIGIPYLDRGDDSVPNPILGNKQISEAAIRSIYAQVISSDEGVRSLESLTTSLGGDRALSVTFSALVFGDDVPITITQEFIL